MSTVRNMVKNLIKLQDIYLTEDEVSLIALIAPNATINKIENWKVVERYKPKIPSTISSGIGGFDPRVLDVS